MSVTLRKSSKRALRPLLTIFSILLGWAAALPAAPLPASRPTTAPTTQPNDEQLLRRIHQLSRRSLNLAEAGKLDEAETVLQQALILAPDHSVNLYNMACLKALKGRSDAALDYLERAASEGFTDFIHIERDPDLNSLRNLPRYKDLLAHKSELQRKAADKVITALKRELGTGYLYEIDEQDKLIFATNTDAPTLAALKKWLLAQARSQWEQVFEHKPDQYISIVLPSAADYRQIVNRPGVGGFYNHDNRILIAQHLGQVMTHEFTHALHNADLDPLNQDHPTWLAEGLATLFESAHFEGDKLVPADNFRLRYIQGAVRRGRLIRLQPLLEMDQKRFVSNATLAYGESGSLLLYLYEQNLLRRFYDTFKGNYDKDKTGKLALEEVTGKSLDDLEQDWKTWIRGRTPPAQSTGPQGAVLGVRFADANDGLQIDLVVPDGPAAAAGIKVGDLLVGIGETDIWDRQSFLPLLASHNPGDTITLKIRRSDKYLELPVTLARRGEKAPAPR